MKSYLLKVWCDNEYADAGVNAALVELSCGWATRQCERRTMMHALIALEDAHARVARSEGASQLSQLTDIRYWDYEPQPFDIDDERWPKDAEGNDQDHGGVFFEAETQEPYPLQQLEADEVVAVQVRPTAMMPEDLIQLLDTSRVLLRQEGLRWVFRTQGANSEVITATIPWEEIETIAHQR